MTADTAAFERLMRRAQAEYLEMPGLCLTCRQAQRLWGLDEASCLAVLSALVESGFLVESSRVLRPRWTGTMFIAIHVSLSRDTVAAKRANFE